MSAETTGAVTVDALLEAARGIRPSLGHDRLETWNRLHAPFICDTQEAKDQAAAVRERAKRITCL